MTERRKIPDEELVEISGGIDVPLEDFEVRELPTTEGDPSREDLREEQESLRPGRESKQPD